ncbi:MAG: DNA ligase (NAD(+)) LigA [Rhodospirillaceae bacterium]|nr:DNA ligase (NAD(+)) LigA [Rhodospirillaceae bacterium]|tara:strand:+ start:104 stop:2227 length:2124 start_codon:yes stop_codon:yes gene_type:complete
MNISQKKNYNTPVDKLSKKEAEEELIRLANLISKYNIDYYINNNSKISDSEYDNLWRRNKLIEEKFPSLVQTNSPSLYIGSNYDSGFTKVKHLEPMLSLSNIFNEKDLDDYITQVNKILGFNDQDTLEIVAEPKIDGVSASILYKDGELFIGSTRGNGFEGEDITENIKVVKGVPVKLKSNDYPELLEIRGEVYMNHEDFIKLNKLQKEDGKPIYSNPRNSASGSLRQLDPRVTAERKLNFFAYTWGASSNYFNTTQWEARKKLEELGFILNEPSKLCRNSGELIKYYNEIIEIRSSLNFDIDGVVYKLNELELQKKVGVRTRSPRWAVAHKLPAEKGVTVIDNIDIQVGRTGSLTPVARLKPINVGGVLITNATLHNSHEIKKKDIRVGDSVVVQRAGDVIPQVLNVILSKRKKNSKKFIFPKNCPECGSDTFSELLSNGEFEKTVRCSGGINCSSQTLEKLNHFVSINALNIEGLGEKQIKFFWEEGLIGDFKDIFLLENNDSQNKFKLSEFSGWGKQSAINLYKSINKSRKIEMYRLIYALGIRHVGVQIAKLLSNYYKEMNFFLDEISSATEKANQSYLDLISIDGVGPKIGDSVVKYFNNKQNFQLVKELLNHLDISYRFIDITESFLNNKVFVLTGSLNNMSRSQAKIKLEKLGAKVSSSVSPKTDYLIAGNKSGSKLSKARQLNIKILSEEDFNILLNSN